MLNRILRRWGAYYRSPDLFYHKLWRDRLTNIGFRVLWIERLCHPVWEVRLRGSLKAQAYLLISGRVPRKLDLTRDLVCQHLEVEIQHIAKDLGPAIKKEFVRVDRSGTYVRAHFLWSKGKPGLWLMPHEKPAAFPLYLRAWLRKRRH